MFHASLVSVATALIGYVVLIPIYSSMGAAIATVLAFATRFLYIYFISKKLYDLEIKLLDILKPLMFFCLVVYTYFYHPLSKYQSLNALIYSIVTLVIFTAWAWTYRKDLIDYLQARKSIKS